MAMMRQFTSFSDAVRGYWPLRSPSHGIDRIDDNGRRNAIAVGVGRIAIAAVGVRPRVVGYRRTGDELAAKYFRPFGFTPERIEGPANRFVPLGGLGYALIHDGEEADPEVPGSRYFALDYSVLETFDGEDLTREWEELDTALADVRAAGVCFCQFCAPSLDLSRFAHLSIVKRQPPR